MFFWQDPLRQKEGVRGGSANQNAAGLLHPCAVTSLVTLRLPTATPGQRAVHPITQTQHLHVLLDRHLSRLSFLFLDVPN